MVVAATKVTIVSTHSPPANAIIIAMKAPSPIYRQVVDIVSNSAIKNPTPNISQKLQRPIRLII